MPPSLPNPWPMKGSPLQCPWLARDKPLSPVPIKPPPKPPVIVPHPYTNPRLRPLSKPVAPKPANKTPPPHRNIAIPSQRLPVIPKRPANKSPPPHRNIDVEREQLRLAKLKERNVERNVFDEQGRPK